MAEQASPAVAVSPQFDFRPLIIAAIVGTLVLGGMGAWFYNYGPCGIVPVKAATTKYAVLLERWSSQVAIAEVTARIALTTPVSQLQTIQDETSALQVPACLVFAKSHMLGFMDAGISGFLAFMSQESDATVGRHFSTMFTLTDAYLVEMERVADCAPLCDPP